MPCIQREKTRSLAYFLVFIKSASVEKGSNPLCRPLVYFQTTQTAILNLYLNLKHWSKMRQITRRLKPGQLLKESIIQLVEDEHIEAGVILAVVGGLENANLRVSKFENGEHPNVTVDGPLELVSCMGTLSTQGCHIHVSVSDRTGTCFGGHLKNGCRVFVTVELTVLVFDDVIYNRTLDDETGFDELSPTPVIK